MSTPILISILCTLIVAFVAYKLFTSSKQKSSEQSSSQKKPSSTAGKLPYDEENPLLQRALNPEEHTDCTVYNLVNCVHCDRLKNFLSENSIPFTPVLVDNFNSEQRQEVMKVLRSYNPRGSFPTLVTPEGEVLIGFREWQARELLLPKENNTDQTNNS